MNTSLRSMSLALIVVLLMAICALLALLAIRGVRVEHTGSVNLGPMQEGIALQMSAPVELVMPEAVRTIATGPDGGAVPLELDFLSCSTCDATMVPVRWNLWTGEIDWLCPDCGEALTSAP